jgi:ABC-2 type transport system ATP-binding protein
MIIKTNPIIEVENLQKRYTKMHDFALDGISLSINKGEFFGLIGPNSAGKTTLISIMCGLLKITSGRVAVVGIDVNRYPRKISSLIGLVPQEIALYPNLTIRENIRYFGQMHGFTGKELILKTNDCISIVKLSNHENKLVCNCSGGIKRRANLIAGLIHNPSVVFLDEPTLGVDAQSRNLIFDYLKRLNKTGTTIIYTTHYMQEAENLCSRIIIIDQGIIIAEGSPESLIQSMDGCSDLGQVFIHLTGKELRD